MSLGRLVLRATIGGLMAGHGLQKLTGAFDGHGLAETEQTMTAIGMYPPKQQALAAALSETIGGGLTAAGLLSPLGPAMIAGTMVVAAKKVHLRNGLWVTKGGYEYNLVLAAGAIASAFEGPGAISLDAIRGKQKSGLFWGLASIGLAAGAAAATLAVSDRMAPPPADPTEALPTETRPTETGGDDPTTEM